MLLAASQNANIETLSEFCKTITSAHPRMASLITLTHTVLQNCRQADVEPLSPIVQESITHFFQNIETSKKRILSECYHLLQPDMRVATFSRSSIVVDTLLQISENTPFHILLTESRPMYEGRVAAKAFSSAGIPVTLFTDAAISDMLQQADIILIGADAVTPQHIINKIGTLPLALCAQHCNTPIYVLATSDKFLDDTSLLAPEPDKPAKEVWPNAPKNISVYNRYFEAVERALLTDILE